jgi:RNA recognition motif-containing protein
MNIQVSNLGAQVTEESLNATFSAYGEVKTASIMLDEFTGKTRGLAMVVMPDESAAIAAIKKLNGAVINGLHLDVKESPSVKVLSVQTL